MNTEAIKLRNSVGFVLPFTILLWLVKGLEYAVGLDFGFFGILPRTLSGTMGIITAPLIHGDILHLLSNTFPLLLLGVSVFYFYDKIALEVFGWIYFMSGFWVWMAARDAYHIGASGIVYGLVAFLFFSGLFRRDTRSLAISLVVIFLYGGMLHGIFPTNQEISWESHLLGALAGSFCAFFYRNVKLRERSDAMADEETSLVAESPKEAALSYLDYQKAVDTYPLQAAPVQSGFFPLPEKPPAGPAEVKPAGTVKKRFIYVISAARKQKKEITVYSHCVSLAPPQWEQSATSA
ncbi:rhomboid family intramembrane serine protease [Nafulsella turpanensis]|uniref:rhomboid family intramembrane serine protease n=1 Tax=Nafulsella turpanensis TaxID=1265690 RepID=UPI00034AE56A|nr:rhomboid family intramembrane serine protease [Nafulsella turpanensis]